MSGGAGQWGGGGAGGWKGRGRSWWVGVGVGRGQVVGGCMLGWGWIPIKAVSGGSTGIEMRGSIL